MQFMKSFFTGTDTDFFAGYRACKCLKGFYRTHMFEKCHKYLQGMACQDDHISLKSGYWWEWRNQTSKGRYQKFIKKSCSCVASTWHRLCAIPSPDPNSSPMSTGGSMQRWSRFSMCRWLRGSTLCSLQFRVLQTTENLQTMFFQEMDYRTVFHRCCRLSGNCGGHSVVNRRDL